MSRKPAKKHCGGCSAAQLSVEPAVFSLAAVAKVVPQEAGNVGPGMAGAIAAFCKWHEQKWTPKSLVTHRVKLSLLICRFGDNRRIATVTTPELWAFLEGVQRLRRNHHVTPEHSFLSRQTSAPEACIAAVTVTNILARVKSLFRWARQLGYREDNPAEFLAVSIPKQKKGVKGCRSFKPAELTQVFTLDHEMGGRTS